MIDDGGYLLIAPADRAATDANVVVSVPAYGSATSAPIDLDAGTRYRVADAANQTELGQAVIVEAPVRGGAVAVTGVELDRYDRLVGLRDKVVAGAARLDPGDAILGRDLAGDLGLQVGDRLTLQTAGTSDSVRITALVDLGLRDLNRRTVLVPLRTGQSLFALPGGATGVDLALRDGVEPVPIATAGARAPTASARRRPRRSHRRRAPARRTGGIPHTVSTAAACARGQNRQASPAAASRVEAHG